MLVVFCSSVIARLKDRREGSKMLRLKQATSVVGVFLVILILIQLVGCGTNKSSENTGDNIDPGVETPNTQVGKTEIFSHDYFKLEITNVQDISIEEMVDDGGTPWEYKVFTCYPNAKVVILEADMSAPEFSADGKLHSKWGIELTSDERIRITDEMEPFEITKDIVGIYNLEASLYILKFEIIE